MEIRAMVLSTLVHDDVRMARGSVPTSEDLLERLRPWIVGDPVTWHLERVYFDTEPEPMPLRSHLRATRRVGSSDGEYVLSHRPSQDEPRSRVPHPMALTEVPAEAARWFGVRDARPQFKATYRCERHVVGPLVLTLLHDVRYAALTNGPDVPLGVERSARAELALAGRGPKEIPKALCAALDEVPSLPQQSMQWMGMHHFRRMFTAPAVNDLPGFEYEVTLSARDANIDLAALPFPVLEIGHTGSVRGYYKGFRAGVRDGTATITRKGDPERIRGVCKRPESKVEVSAWTLDPKAMQMFRYKRSINVINPTTRRVYTICLQWDPLESTCRHASLSIL